MIILCGAADRAITALGGRTPLEASDTPELSKLAREGQLGTIAVIGEGICPESDSGGMALLGYDPLKAYTGRGALEALGLGFMRPGDNAAGFRINFGSFNREVGKIDRRTARDLSDPELQQLVAELGAHVRLEPDGVSWSIMGFGRHRGIVCFASERLPLSGNVSNTDPGFIKQGAFGIPTPEAERANHPLPCQPLDDSPGARNTARLVNSFCAQASEILARSEVNLRRRREGRLEANVVLFRDGGSQTPDLRPFRELFGVSAAFFGQIPAEQGLCKLVGAEWQDARRQPSEALEDYYRALAARVAACDADVTLVHVKEADEPGHDGDPAAKLAAIERIDRHFLAPLRAAAGDGVTWVVTCDHATPCDLRIHSADPVPLLICAPSLRADRTTAFTERQAGDGALSIARACDLMPFLQTLRAA